MKGRTSRHDLTSYILPYIQMNNPLHNFSVEDFFEKIDKKSREGYMKKVSLSKLFSEKKQNGIDWDMNCWETDARMEELGL